MASFNSSGQSTRGGRSWVAGRDKRMTAVGDRLRRSSRALVKWVVPTITASTCAPRGFWASSSVTAAIMPEVTSGVVGDLAAPASCAPSIRTASVLVPPTSTPMNINQRLHPTPPL